MNEDKMREQFEAWMITVSVASSIDRDESGLYKSSLAVTAWISWQAALSQIEPVQVSQPMPEHIREAQIVLNDYLIRIGSPPDYEALRAENEALRQRLAELEQAK